LHENLLKLSKKVPVETRASPERYPGAGGAKKKDQKIAKKTEK